MLKCLENADLLKLEQVQADVISILTDKPEILTLDLFSQLAPVLTGLLGSRTER